MARVEPRVDDDRASLADAAASRCRARADVVRDALASAHREFTARGTLDEPLVSAALDAFDGRIARAVAHDAPALGGFVDATEAQLLKRDHGAALSNLLAFARATAVARSRLAVDVASSSPHERARLHETTGEGGLEGGPGAALELMLLFPRAENARAALLAHYSDELTRCLDGIDGASRAGDDAKTAVAVGAVFWLARRLDVRGTDAKPHAPSFDEIERVLTPMVRARAATEAAAAFSPTAGGGGASSSSGIAELAAKLAAVAAAARAQLSCLSSLPERPGGEFIARVYGAPAAAVVGEALDDVLDAMTRHPTGDDADGGGGGATGSVKNSLKTEEEDDEDGKAAHRACVAGVRAWATVRAVADGFALVTLPAAVNDSLDANAWRPTLDIIRDSLTARVAFVLEAAFASRRETYECTLRRFAFPSAATLLKPLRRFDFPHGVRTPATTPAMKASEVWNACAGALREAAAVVSAIVASPPRDEGVVDVVRNGRNGRAGDRAAGVVATCVACLERVALVAEYALRGDLNVTDDVTAQSFQMGFDDAWTVMSAASRARRLARGCEAAVLEGSPVGWSHGGSDTGSDTGSAFSGSESRVVAAAKTAVALATKLDRVAGAAEARAIRALLRPATMTLEGAASQPWRWHRKPECMPNEPPWSPHVDAWATSVDAAAARLARVKSRDVSGARMIAALATLAAAEAAGVYLRTTPSRAWRDRFAWDCRRVATAIRDVDVYVYDASSVDAQGRYPVGESDSLGRSRRVAIAKALVTRAALLRADVHEVIELLPELAAHVGLGMAKVATGHGADDVASIARGHPWGPGPSPEELWDEEELWDQEVDGGDGGDGDGDGDGDEKSAPGDPWRWLLRDAATRPRPTTSAEVLELDASWRAAEDALARTAPIASVHAALWRRSELADDDQTPLDEAEAAGKEAVRAEIERRGGGVAAAGADDGGFGGWGDGVEFY